MATQLVSVNVNCQQAGCQKVMQISAAYGERGSNRSSLSYRRNYGYHRIGNGTQPASNFIEHSGHEEGTAKYSRKRGRQAPKLGQLGFSYLASSFHYILRKVKTFYNGFLGEDIAEESRMGSEASMVEPYFSIPVLPNTSCPPIL